MLYFLFLKFATAKILIYCFVSSGKYTRLSASYFLSFSCPARAVSSVATSSRRRTSKYINDVAS